MGKLTLEVAGLISEYSFPDDTVDGNAGIGTLLRLWEYELADHDENGDIIDISQQEKLDEVVSWIIMKIQGKVRNIRQRHLEIAQSEQMSEEINSIVI